MAQPRGKERIGGGRTAGEGRVLMVFEKCPMFIHSDRNNDERNRP